MGHKIHPKSVRLGYIEDWTNKWFSRKEMPDFIEEDQKIKGYLKDKLRMAAVSKIGIERAGKYVRVNIYTARPGIVIGKGGQEIENLRTEVENMTTRKVFVNVIEIKRPELDAQLVAEGIALQLEKRIAFRRAMKKAMEKSMSSGALGIKVQAGGRLGGAEIARREWMKEGRVPLQTFRADIDFGFAEAFTTMGQIGVKVWIFKKELFKKTEKELMEEAKVIDNVKVADIVEPVVEAKEEIVPEKEAGNKEVE